MNTPTKSGVYTIKLPKALIDVLLNNYGYDNISKAVKEALDFSMSVSTSELISEPAMLGKYANVSERKNWKSFNIRIQPFFMSLFMEKMKPFCNSVTSGLYGISSRYSEAVLLALLNYLYLVEHNKQVEVILGTNLKVINILGSKWCIEMQNAISAVLSSASLSINTSVETCAGALGILSNHKCANREIVNDDDWEKINLYRCIQKHPFELMEKCLNQSLTTDSFNELKEKRRKIEVSSDINIKAAAIYYVLNNISYRNTGNTLKDNLDERLYRQHCFNILNLNRRLRSVSIQEGDLFRQIQKHRNEAHTLLFVDPPYLDTNCYKGRKISKKTEKEDNFDILEHIQLAKALNSIKGYFMYFCRITATRSSNKNGELTLSQEELAERDTILKTKIDDMYCKKGNYFLDVELNKDKGTERIITNFPFAGATPYFEEEGGVCHG